MSNVEGRGSSAVETSVLEERFAAACVALERGRRIEQGQAGAMVFAAAAYGDALEENKLFQIASHWGRLVCIAALFIIPNLLVIRILL